MRILILYPDNPFPPHFGGAQRVLGISRNLARYGHEVHLLCEKRVTNGTSIRIFDEISVHYHSFDNHEKLVSLCHSIAKSEQIDIVQVEYILQMYPVIMRFSQICSLPLVVDTHNVNYVLAQRLNYRKSMVQSIRFIEWLTSHFSDMYLCASLHDKKYFEAIQIPSSKLAVIPNGVEVRPLSAGNFQSIFDAPTVTFMANFGWIPYYKALKQMTDQVMPKVLRKHANAQFLALGRWPQALRKIKRSYLVYATNVKDTFPYLRASSLCVAPIEAGSGTKLKILEYFLAGKPVVSTYLGIEGLSARDGCHVMIENDVRKFDEKIVYLLEHPEYARLMGHNARKLVERKYDWKRIVRKLVTLYERLLQK